MLRQLLSHTSGLSDYYEQLGDDARGITNERALATLFDDDCLLFVPGSDWAYSNTAFVALAQLIERVSCESYAKFLSERVLQPAGMSQTYVVDRAGIDIPNAAIG
jgi:CubicO group peptidase (beta-lactamase class C family)